jgi:LppX_LprAFG lipoprotein
MKRAALASLLVAVTVAGCGGGSSQPASTDQVDISTSAAPQAQAVLAAGQRTSAETSARVSFKATFTGDTNGTMTGEGVFSQRQGHLTMDLGGLTGVGTGQAEIVFDKLVYYMKLPPGSGASLPPGKEWFKLDFAKLGKQQGLDLSQLMQLNQSDPSQALDFLQGASDDFEEVGQEEVRGEQTTHYKGTVDLEKVAQEAPADVQEQYRELSELTGDKKVPMDVWIGDDGLVRKIAFTQAVPNGGSVKMEEELYDFGTDEQVEVPSDDAVVDLTALLGNS